MTPLLKTVAGHPGQPAGAAPQDPALAAFLAADVAVGANLPVALGFPAGGWTFASVMSLTHSQLDDLDWFYNERFAGVTIALRQESLLQFLGGL